MESNKPGGPQPQRTRQGARLIAVVQILSQAARIFGGLAIALLLGPESYGVVGWILLVSVFLDEILRDIGFGAVLVQQSDEPGDEISSLFWLNASIGGVFTIGLAVFGPDLARLIGEPRVGGMARMLGLMLLVAGSATINWALLRRRMQFGRVALLQFMSALLGSGLPLVLYAFGLREWAVVWGLFLANFAVTVTSFILTRWRPTARFRRSDLRPYLAPSADLTVARLAAYGAQNGDRFMAGVYLGSAALGLYGFAFRLIMPLIGLLATVGSDVLFPALSRLQDRRGELALGFRRAVVVTAVVISLPMLTLHVAAAPLVGLLSDEWAGIESLVRILALAALPQALMSTVFPVMMAAGKTRLMLKWSVTTSISALIAYWIGAQVGLTAIAWSFLVVLLVLFAPHMAITGRCAGIGLRPILADLVPVAVCDVILVGAGYASQALLVELGAPDIIQLGVTTVVCAVAFSIAAIWMRLAAFAELVAFVPRSGFVSAKLDRRCTRGPSPRALEVSAQVGSGAAAGRS